MCSIAGVRDANRPIDPSNVQSMLAITRHRGPDGAGLATSATTRWGATVEDLDLKGVEDAPWVLGQVRLAITGKQGIQPIQDCSQNIWVVANGEVWNHESLRAGLGLRHELRQDTDVEVIPHLVEEELGASGDLTSAVARVARRLDGEFAFAVATEQELVVVRDPAGTKPIYFGFRDDQVGFASERRALFKMGFPARRVEPGHVQALAPDASSRPFVQVAASTESAEAASGAEYARAIRRAVEKRVDHDGPIGIVFSGGVDSALVAQLAGQARPDVTLFVAGFPDAPDVEAAQEAAEAMGLPLVLCEMTDESVRRAVPQLVESIEERNQLHIETALPLWHVCQRASQMDVRVLLTGQGADEIHGGYRWYPSVLDDRGAEGLRKQMDEDRRLLDRECLEREDKVAMSSGIEMRVPFLDPEVVAAVMRIPISAQIVGTDDTMGKRVHRRVAEEVGVPTQIAWRVKEAAQHGSGVHDALLRVAPPAPDRGYDAWDSLDGPVGSSQRYGHEHMPEATGQWTPDDGLQFWLDRLSLETGIIAQEDRAPLERRLALVAEVTA